MSHPTGCFHAAYRAKAQFAWFPASARWHVFSISAFSFVPHGSRIQTHRSRSRYRHGFERALDCLLWSCLIPGSILKERDVNNQFLPPFTAGERNVVAIDIYMI
jgi:hypothetical protein